MNPPIKILILNWNGSEYTQNCLSSIKNIQYDNFTTTVIDNSSSDGTIKKLREIKDDRFKIYSINNEGILAKSRNLGIEQSNAEWVAFLDSDDWWTETKLEEKTMVKINNIQ